MIKYSFKQWCLDNDRQDLLDRWDYDLNNVYPSDIEKSANKKYYFKCPNCKHESELFLITSITSNNSMVKCKMCNSFAQHIIDTYGVEYLDKIWSDKNEKSPWDYSWGMKKKVWFNCLNNPDHVYLQSIVSKSNGCMCTICNSNNRYTKIAIEKSLGGVYPQSFDVWSQKNDNTPYDYAPFSDKYVFWKCENGVHEDYRRKVRNSTVQNFKCSKCVLENKVWLTGSNNHNWKGTTPEVISARQTMEYKTWRWNVYKRDNFLCQSCLEKSHDKLQAHHIFSFAKYKDLRYRTTNGITLCEQCHDSRIQGSFHNIYGTHNNTPEQLEEYINRKRQELGIAEPFNIYDYMSSFDDDDMEIDDYGLDISSFDPEWVRVSETGICSISIPLTEIEI